MTGGRRFAIDGQNADRAEVRDVLGSGHLDELFAALLSHRPAVGACPHCGVTEADIERTGLVGCPLCYAVHHALILQVFPPQAFGST